MHDLLIDQEHTKTAMVGTGHFVSWDGGFLMIGSAAGLTPMHAHYAIQIRFGAEHGIRFRSSERAPWTSYDGVVISLRQPHAMDATTVSASVGQCRPVSASVVLFVEPETREGRALTHRRRRALCRVGRTNPACDRVHPEPSQRDDHTGRGASYPVPDQQEATST